MKRDDPPIVIRHTRFTISLSRTFKSQPIKYMQRLALSLYIGKHADYLIHIYVYISRCCRIMNHFHLGRDRYVTVRTFQDKEYVHIRCFKEYPNNPKLYPIAKGIALPLERFKTRCESVNVIEEWYTNQRCLFSYWGKRLCYTECERCGHSSTFPSRGYASTYEEGDKTNHYRVGRAKVNHSKHRRFHSAVG